MDTMPTAASVNPQIEERQSPSFFSKYKFTLISLCIILVALIPLLILSRHKSTSAPVSIAASPTPTATPLTEQNVDPTLSATDQSIQSALTQSNQDISQANQVDSSQDSVAGL